MEHGILKDTSTSEKSLLLSRMMTFFEKKFADDIELMAMFLDTVLFVYKLI